jgi:cytochrome P450
MTSPAVLPKALWLNPLQLWRNICRPQMFHTWLREHVGPVAPIRVHGLDHVMVLTAEGARQVFGADPAGYDPFFKEMFTGVAGPASLWVVTGEAHRRERRLFAPAVNANHVGRYLSTIREISRFHLEQWQPRQTIRALDTTLAISRDVLMRLVFGVEDPALMAEGREVLDGLRRTGHPLPVFVVQLQRPWFPIWRRYLAAKTAFSDWVRRLLLARRARGVAGETDDVVGRMLAARQDDGSRMRDDEICDELNTILQGGHQTTAAGVAWALYELGRHPEVLTKLRNELESSGADADPGAVVRLPYLKAVCNEAIRLHPVLPECARMLAEPVEILGYTIPAGTALVVSITAIHHHPALYPEPDQFIPERFIERSYSPSEFLPFGGAHRRCVGAMLAECAMRIALAETVCRWDFEAAAVERNVRLDLAMGPKHAVRLHIKEREVHTKFASAPTAAEAVPSAI